MRCVYCGDIRARVIVAGGYAHRRCVGPDPRKGLSVLILEHLPKLKWYGREAIDLAFCWKSRRVITQALKRLERRGLIRWSTSDGKHGFTRLV